MVRRIFLPAHERQHNTTAQRRHALIYFICGNPGLIDFYQDFLGCLAEMLRVSDVANTTAFDICGRDLLGFSDDDHEPFGSAKGGQPWDLEGQIEGIYADVAAQSMERPGRGDKVNNEVEEDRGRKKTYDYVIIMGHSVGAYIAVEICERHRRSGRSRSGAAPHMDLRHGVLLFPTLTHIAQSPSGRKATAVDKWVLQPVLGEATGRTLAAGARLLTALLPRAWMVWFLQRVNGFTEEAAGTAAGWLKSRDGVWQTVHLGLSEMREIAEDVWEEELWKAGGGEDEDDGDDAVAAREDGPRRFYAFYAREDHWVANRWRDEFVERRKGAVRVVVDEGDVPHAFCTREGKFVSSFPLWTVFWEGSSARDDADPFWQQIRVGSWRGR